MKAQKTVEDDRAKSDLWTDLEEAVNDAANLAHMLACTVEERYGQAPTGRAK
jgi:hypothetical protein